MVLFFLLYPLSLYLSSPGATELKCHSSCVHQLQGNNRTHSPSVFVTSTRHSSSLAASLLFFVHGWKLEDYKKTQDDRNVGSKQMLAWLIFFFQKHHSRFFLNPYPAWNEEILVAGGALKTGRDDHRPVRERTVKTGNRRSIHLVDDTTVLVDASEEERRSFRESKMAASTPVHSPFTPAQVTLTADGPPPFVHPVGVICRLWGLCDKCVECWPWVAYRSLQTSGNVYHHVCI